MNLQTPLSSALFRLFSFNILVLIQSFVLYWFYFWFLVPVGFPIIKSFAYMIGVVVCSWALSTSFRKQFEYSSDQLSVIYVSKSVDCCYYFVVLFVLKLMMSY